MAPKPAVIIGSAGGNNVCVLVETTNEDGTTSRFMSFHWNQRDAEAVKEAHEKVNDGKPNVKISMFPYRSLPSSDTILSLARLDTLDIFVDYVCSEQQ